MATIPSKTLIIKNVNATTVTVTVKYTLKPSDIEKLAGSVFREDIQLIGDDPGVLGDIVITNFPTQVYAVSVATPAEGVVRTRSRNVLKSALNEDPQFETTGAEVVDETFARINLTYAANAPDPPTLPGPTSTNLVTGAWK